MNDLKYEYGVHTWGGFYNDHNRAIHHFEEGTQYFPTKELRHTYLNSLENARRALTYSDATLAKHLFEGFNIRDLPVIHRVVEYRGKQYYSKYEYSWPETASVLLYYMENKWYPGLNDDTVEETVGHSVDYKEVKIIQEWLSGSIMLEVND